MNTNQDKVNNIIKELIVELKAKYSDFRGIYLFGSYARGEATDDSDIDLAVIFDREIDWRFKDEIRSITSLSMVKHQYLIDTLIYNFSDINNPKTPIRENIKFEGAFYGN